MLTEYFRVMELPDRSQWIRFTQIVDDPEYLTAAIYCELSLQEASRRLEVESDSLPSEVTALGPGR